MAPTIIPYSTLWAAVLLLPTIILEYPFLSVPAVHIQQAPGLSPIPKSTLVNKRINTIGSDDSEYSISCHAHLILFMNQVYNIQHKNTTIKWAKKNPRLYTGGRWLLKLLILKLITPVCWEGKCVDYASRAAVKTDEVVRLDHEEFHKPHRAPRGRIASFKCGTTAKVEELGVK